MDAQGTRLNRYIAESGYCSRREADRLIAEGQVRIDGRTAQLGDRVTEGMRVTISGRMVGPKPGNDYILLYKPVGIVCTTDPREPNNVVDYVHFPRRIFPVGRLDADSEGLLLLTNDGAIVNRMLRAAGRHEKEYEVTIDKPVTEDFLRQLRAGVPILGTVTLPCQAKKTGERSFNIVLVQGLNRQIRRMCEYLGCRVRHLKRIRIMNLRLDGMRPGEWRELTDQELRTLQRMLDK